MAYIPQDDEEKKTSQMDVLEQEEQQLQTVQPSQTQQVGQQDVKLGGTGSQIGTGQPQQPQRRQTGTQKKGSGLFTDIRKYVKANKPQAQKLAQAAGQKLQQKATQIGQGLQQRQQAYQQGIQEQQQALGQAQQFTQQALERAQRGEMLGEDQLGRFRDVATGREKFGDVGRLNVAQQAQRARQLANLAQQSERATGASRLLQETFGDRQYTGGQRALDELILGGDVGAREALTTGAMQTAEQTQQAIRDARMQALARAAELGREDIGLREQLSTQLQTAREQVQQDVQSRLEAARENVRQQQQALQEKIESGTLTTEDLQQYIDRNQLLEAAQTMEAERQALLSPEITMPEEQNRLGGITEQTAQLYQRLANLGIDRQGLAETIRQRALAGETGYESVLGTPGDQGYVFEADPENIMQMRKIQADQLSSEDVLKRFFGDPNLARMGREALGQLDYYTGAGPETVSALIREQAQQLQPQTQEALQQRILQDINQAARRGIDVTDYLQTVDPEQLRAEQYLTEEDLARQRALAALAGQQGTGFQEIQEAPERAATFQLADILRNIGGIGVV